MSLISNSTTGTGSWGARSMTTEVHEKSQNAMPPRVYGYEIIDFLGEGAGSVIYPRSGQIYALKHVVVKKEKDVRFIEQLTNEFEISSKVKHPLLRRCIDLKV